MPYNCSHDQCTGTDNCTFTSKQKALGINDFTKVWLTKYDILESESVLLIKKCGTVQKQDFRESERVLNHLSADSQWCERDRGSDGGYLGEGSPFWDDESR